MHANSTRHETAKTFLAATPQEQQETPIHSTANKITIGTPRAIKQLQEHSDGLKTNNMEFGACGYASRKTNQMQETQTNQENTGNTQTIIETPV